MALHVVPGSLIARDPLEAEGVELFGAGVADHVGDHHLAPLGVGPADHRHLLDRRVALQHLLDLARVDVAAAGDDQVPGAVEQGEIPVLVEAADVAGVEPAAPHGGRGRLGVLPVAEHDRVAPNGHLADFAGRLFLARGIDDAQRHVAEGPADRGQLLQVPRLPAFGDVSARQGGDRHRALTLTVDLNEFRAERLRGFQNVLKVHRRAP